MFAAREAVSLRFAVTCLVPARGGQLLSLPPRSEAFRDYCSTVRGTTCGLRLDARWLPPSICELAPLPRLAPIDVVNLWGASAEPRELLIVTKALLGVVRFTTVTLFILKKI